MPGKTEMITIESYNSEWPRIFRDLAGKLRDAIGSVALRIDHIGSTAIPGLAAKPIIDIQISVASFEPTDPYRRPLEELGFEYRDRDPQLTRRYFREPRSIAEGTHIHVRLAGSFSEQLNLLFRDYLRCHAADAHAYAELKCQLAQKYRGDRPGYTEAKDSFIWDIMRRADKWAQDTGWQPGRSDA